MLCCKADWRVTRMSEQERIHRERRREISGCAQCGIEIKPGEFVMVCGIRFDRWTLCAPCYRQKRDQSTYTAPMYQEKVLWEVDPGPAVDGCTTAASALAATLQLYHDRPCLGYPVHNDDIATACEMNSIQSIPRSDIPVNARAQHVSDYAWLSYGEVLQHATTIGVGLRAVTLLNVEPPQSTGNTATSSLNPLNPDKLSFASIDATLTAKRMVLPPRGKILLYAEASVDWYLVQFGCILQELLVVPVLDGTSVDQLQGILSQCAPDIVVTSRTQYTSAITAITRCAAEHDGASWRAPVVVLIASASESPFNCSTATDWDQDAEMGKRRDALGVTHIANLGRYMRTNRLNGTNSESLTYASTSLDLPSAHSSSASDGDSDAKVSTCDEPKMLIPTSGSSGQPKLIIVTDAMMLRQFQAPSFGARTIMYSFQPIRQSFDTLIKGGQIGMWSGDLGALHHDMAVLRPTHFGSTPAFWMSQMQQFTADVEARVRQEVPATTAGHPERFRTLADAMAMARVQCIDAWKQKRLLGNRCQLVLVGGATSTSELKAWIWDVFGVSVVDGYGASETGAIASNTNAVTSSMFQLLDVPEMGYLTSDTPFPRGEIVATSGRITPGYYNDRAANAKAFVTINGRRFFRTGDIGMLVAGKITVIDRKSAMFKLANGCFVAPAPLEALYAQSPLITQALVYRHPSARSVGIAVVLTEAGMDACMEQCASVADASGIAAAESIAHNTTTTRLPQDSTLDLTCITGADATCEMPDTARSMCAATPQIPSPRFHPQPILRECVRLASQAGCKGHEIPQAVVHCTEAWTVENGGLTPSLKVCRRAVLRLIGDAGSETHVRRHVRSDAVMGAADSLTSPAADKISNCESTHGLSAGLVNVLAATIPSFASIDVQPDATVYSLGADSLALAVLRTSLETRFGLCVPLTRLVGATLGALNTAILGGGVACLPDVDASPMALQQEAEGVREAWRRARDGMIPRQCDTNRTRDGVPVRQCGVNPGTSRHNRARSSHLVEHHSVLLTGATGFVGAFLLDEFLRCNETAHVMCLVRARDDHAATVRVQETLQQYCLQCDPNRWTALAGDLAKPIFGLASDVWDHLVEVVGMVFHAGAVVNASLPLAAIRDANIVGTRTIIELCVAADAALHHISSASVVAGAPTTDEALSVTPPPKAATAYAKSKWVAEQLVGYAVVDCGLRARIYRLGTMGGHSKTGVCNPHDTLTRIVQGLQALGAVAVGDTSPLPQWFLLAPIDWAVHVVCKYTLRPFFDHSRGRSIPPSDVVVDVVHVVSRQPTPLHCILAALASYGIALQVLSGKEFQEKLASVDVTHPMYTFRDVFHVKINRSKAPPTLRCAKILACGSACPAYGEASILHMLRYLFPSHPRRLSQPLTPAKWDCQGIESWQVTLV